MNLQPQTVSGREDMSVDLISAGGAVAGVLGGVAGVGALATTVFARVRGHGMDRERLRSLERRVDSHDKKIEALDTAVRAVDVLSEKVDGVKTLIVDSLKEMKETINEIAPRRVASAPRARPRTPGS